MSTFLTIAGAVGIVLLLILAFYALLLLGVLAWVGILFLHSMKGWWM